MSELTDKLKEIGDMPLASHRERATHELLAALVKQHEELRADHLALVKKVKEGKVPAKG